jgi:hypothetical protein
MTGALDISQPLKRLPSQFMALFRINPSTAGGEAVPAAKTITGYHVYGGPMATSGDLFDLLPPLAAAWVDDRPSGRDNSGTAAPEGPTPGAGQGDAGSRNP